MISTITTGGTQLLQIAVSPNEAMWVHPLKLVGWAIISIVNDPRPWRLTLFLPASQIQLAFATEMDRQVAVEALLKATGGREA